VTVNTVLNVLTNDIGDILDLDEPSHCICMDCAHFKLSDCPAAQCHCCLDRCGELSQKEDNSIDEGKLVQENAAAILS
jgi:hypothetical protein